MRGPSGPSVGVQHGETDLVLVGVEIQEELFDLVDDLADASVAAIDLVHDDDDRQAGLERLSEHEAGLGQRALGGVDQEQHPVDHRETALDLPAEIGVARACRRW